MTIKAIETLPDPIDPFLNCKLNREKYADVLTEIVERYKDGFVLAINNEWGTGKTTFVKMWQQQLKNEGFQTIYFNAWENDFDSNPLVALMSELETLTNAKNKKLFKSVVEKGAVFLRNIAPLLAKSLIKKYVVDVSDIRIDAIENATKASTEILEEEIKEYSSKKKTIIEFREELEKFVKQADNPKPLVFIIDELDRCRPNYSVEVLEQIKHFFSVPGIVFVLSIDKQQLSHAIKGYYGSSEIDAPNYLRRFIDIEYSLPQPDYDEYCKFLYAYYDFDAVFKMPGRHSFSHLRNDGDRLLQISILLSKEASLSLRIIEKLFTQTKLACIYLKNNTTIIPELLFTICYFKIKYPEFYSALKENKLPFNEINKQLSICMPSTIDKDSKSYLMNIEALVLHFYNVRSPQEFKVNYSKKNGTDVLESKELPYSKYDIIGPSEELKNLIIGYQNNYNLTSLQYLNIYEKLDLIESFK